MENTLYRTKRESSVCLLCISAKWLVCGYYETRGWENNREEKCCSHAVLSAAKSFFQDCNAFSALSGQRRERDIENERTCCSTVLLLLPPLLSSTTFTFALTANITHTGLGFEL